MDLIATLVEQLGVDEGQAKGGAGLLFKLAQDKLGSGDFAQIADKIPGLDSMMDAAPAESGGGGLMGAIGGMLGGLGGNAGALGNLASLAGGFDKLGLDSGMVNQFIPVVMKFVQEQGGDDIMGLIQKVMGGDA